MLDTKAFCTSPTTLATTQITWKQCRLWESFTFQPHRTFYRRDLTYRTKNVTLHMGGHLNLTFSKWFSQTGPSATGTRAHVPKLHHGSAFTRLHPYDKTTRPNQLSANTSWNYPRSWLTKTCEFQVILPSRNTVLCLTQNAQAFVAHSLWTTQSYITKSFSERKQSIWLFFIEDRFYVPIPSFCSIPVSLLSLFSPSL